MKVNFKEVGVSADINDTTFETIEIEYKYLYEVLFKQFPNGFETEKLVYVNKQLVDFEDFDKFELIENDLVLIAENVGAVAVPFLIMIVINIVISLILYMLMKPDKPTTTIAGSVYSGSVKQIEAGLNDSIQIQYGQFRFYPKLVAATYKFYISNIEYHLIHTCSGMGSVQPIKYYLNDTNIVDLVDINQVKTYNSKRGSKLNYLAETITAFGQSANSTYFGLVSHAPKELENITINAVESTVREIGYTVINPDTTKISKILVNIAFENGIYGQNDTGSDIAAAAVMNIIIKEIDDNDIETGYQITRNLNYTRLNRTPQRFTEKFDVKEGRYKIYVNRTDSKDSRSNNGAKLVGVIGIESDTGFTAADDLTLTSFLVKVGEGFSATSGLKMNILAERDPEIIGGETLKFNTLLDFVKDIWQNTEYGMGESLLSLDIQEELLDELSLVLDKKDDAYKQLQNVLKSFGYYIYPYLNHFVIKKDKLRNERTLLFTSKNTKEITFSYKLQDENKKLEGVQGKYIKSGDLNFTDITYPDNMKTYTSTTLLGINSEDKALEFLKTFYNKKKKQLKNCQVKTDLEGLVPELGSRVGVATDYLDNSITVEGKSLINGICVLKQKVKLLANTQYYAYVETENNFTFEMSTLVISPIDIFTDIITFTDSGLGIDSDTKFIISIGDRVEVIEDYLITDIKPGEFNEDINSPTEVNLILKEYLPDLYPEGGREQCLY